MEECLYLVYMILFTTKNYRSKIFFTILSTVCGENKRLEEAITTFIDYQEKGDEGLCTNVPISDRFSLTAAHCLEEGADR